MDIFLVRPCIKCMYIVNKSVKAIKVKVSYGVLAVGTVDGRGTLYLGQRIREVVRIYLLSEPYPSLIRKRYQLTAGLTVSVAVCPNANSNPRPFAP